MTETTPQMCHNCTYFKTRTSRGQVDARGTCLRYPKQEQVGGMSWCGEFIHRENGKRFQWKIVVD